MAIFPDEVNPPRVNNAFAALLHDGYRPPSPEAGPVIPQAQGHFIVDPPDVILEVIEEEPPDYAIDDQDRFDIMRNRIRSLDNYRIRQLRINELIAENVSNHGRWIEENIDLRHRVDVLEAEVQQLIQRMIDIEFDRARPPAG